MHGVFGMPRTTFGEAGKGRKGADFRAVEQAVGEFAHEGQQRWRQKGIRLEPLLALDAVQETMNPQGEGPDAQRDAVEAAIEAAVERLGNPEREAARAYFGFDGDSQKRGARQTRAGEILGMKDRTFRGTRGDPSSPQAQIVRLVTVELVGEGDPLDAERSAESLAARAEELEPDGPAGAMWLPIVILACAAFAGLGGLGGLANLTHGWGGGGGDPIPPRGSIVDARTGQVFAAQLVRPRADSRGLVWKNILWACDRSAEDCSGPQPESGSTTVAAGAGDTIDFRIRLYDPRGEPVSVLRLAAKPVLTLQGTSVRLSIEWPVKAHRPGGGLGLETHHDAVTLKLPPQTLLVYDEGSTVLYGAAGEKVAVARLPEGIMDPPGIKLRNVGTPPDCWDCSLGSVRYVGFEATVE